MAAVRPFRGMRYDLARAGDLSSLISPPYDVITPAQQESYHRRNPHNIVRLEFARDLHGDNERANKYARAAEILRRWIADGILIREDTPAFYLVEHRYPYQQAYLSYRGLMAAVRLEPFESGDVRPTEIIMKGPAQDRLRLLRSCRANFSPIMGIFDHESNDFPALFDDAARELPNLSACDDSGITYNVWIIRDTKTVQRVSEFFDGRPLYIADGHHRYTTALAYREELGPRPAAETSPAAADYIMMTLIAATDPGLRILPTHRLLRRADEERLSNLAERLKEHFDMSRYPVSASHSPDGVPAWKRALAEAGRAGPAFAAYGVEPGVCLVLTARDPSNLKRQLPADKPSAWRNLDVSLLHAVILDDMLALNGPEAAKDTLDFSADEEALIRAVDEGTAALAFFLNPVPARSVIDVADAGVRMPPKSTYFYPKTPAGLVINPLW